MAKATAEEIKIITDACQNNLQLPVSYEKDGLSISTNKQVQELAQRAILRNLAQEMNKQQNIESILECTKQVLEKETEVSNEQVSLTWLSNFFEAAGHVEEENLQKIWGKLLAGEIKRPNSYSLRTLNVLKNITQQEAIVFQKLLPFVVVLDSAYVLPDDNALEEKYHIEFEDILLLDECGLLKNWDSVFLGAKGAGKLFTAKNKNISVEFYNTGSEEIAISLKIYPLTQAGKELFSIIDTESSTEFFDEYIKEITNKYPKTSIVQNRV